MIGVGRRANHRRGNDDLLLATFSLDVLGVLNRAAESLSLRERTRENAERNRDGQPGQQGREGQQGAGALDTVP